MADPDIAFCEPAMGPLAAALRVQHPNAGCDPTKAAVCVLDAGDDASTLAQLATIVAKPQNTGSSRPQIIVHIADRVLRDALDARLEQADFAPRPIVVSADALIAENLVSQNPLFKLAWWREQRQVHVVMVGFGSLGRALLDEIVLNGIADGLTVPLIDIIAPDADQIRAALDREMPDIKASATINCIDWPAANNRLQPLDLDRCEANGPITAIVVLLDDRHATLLACADLCNRQERQRRAIAPIFVAGKAAGLVLALTTPKRAPNHVATTLHAIETLVSMEGLLDFILVGRDVVAQRVHAAYEARYAQQTAAGKHWSDLAETYRRANRRAARHLPQKLFLLGIDSCPDPARAHLVNPRTFADLITPLSQSTVEDDIVRRLARLEHDRWCADRRLDGWVYGESRDDLRRTHPSLVSFDDPRLTSAEIEKDIAQLRFLLGLVVAPDERGASVRMSIGIVEQTGSEQSGIDDVDVRQRLDLETDRDVVVLSPLRTIAEITATHVLLGRLDRLSRRSRLCVVHPLADGLQPILPSVTQSDLREELLARDTTFVVAIGASMPLPGSDWEDVSADRSITDVAVSYVVTRSDVLLNLR